jgi:hypothetical protein
MTYPAANNNRAPAGSWELDEWKKDTLVNGDMAVYPM